MRNLHQDYLKIQDQTAKSLLRSARDGYERLLQNYPEHSPYLCYQYAVFNRSHIGNGKDSRRLFMKAIEYREGGEEIMPLDEMEANASENLMLLSLSFEEYYSWADRLSQLQPQSPIILGQRPMVKEMQENGQAWATVLQWVAANYYHRDQNQDPGLYAEALSTYHLLLENRRQLRLPRDDYRNAVVAYGAVAKLAAAKYGINMERMCGKTYPNEVDIIIEPIMPYIEEYLSRNPEDGEVKQSFELLKQFMSVLKTGQVSSYDDTEKSQKIGNIEISNSIRQALYENRQPFMGKSPYAQAKVRKEQNIGAKRNSVLPFSFDLPNSYIVEGSGPKYLVIKRDNEFRLVLTSGTHSGLHARMPGYKLLEKRDLSTPSGKVRLIVAKGWVVPFLPRYILASAICWPLIYFILHDQISLSGLIVIGILGPLSMIIKMGTPIKYAFVYNGLEYVFTGRLKQRQEIERVIESIRF